MLNSFLQSSYSVYVILFALILIILFLLTTILRLIIRAFFRTIKFSIILFITACLIALFIGKSFVSPFSSAPKDSLVSERAMTDAVSSFKGIYNKKLPLLAWKFSEIKPTSTTDDEEIESMLNQVFDSDADTPNQTTSNQPAPVRIRVSYFPFGSVILSYNIQNHTFALEEGLNQGRGSNLIETLFGESTPALLNELPKTK